MHHRAGSIVLQVLVVSQQSLPAAILNYAGEAGKAGEAGEVYDGGALCVQGGYVL